MHWFAWHIKNSASGKIHFLFYFLKKCEILKQLNSKPSSLSSSFHQQENCEHESLSKVIALLIKKIHWKT